jgi:hypothetical protein
MNSIVAQLMDKYRPSGLMKAGELLLPAQAALQLIDELEGHHALILGIDVWYEVDGHIAQDLGSLDLSNSNDMMLNSGQAREFIKKYLPEKTKFVSVVFDESSLQP